MVEERGEKSENKGQRFGGREARSKRQEKMEVGGQRVEDRG